MSKRQRRQHKKTRALSAQHEGLNAQTHPDAAGIDIGAEELVVAVPPGRCEGRTVRTFSSFTGGVHALRDWLLQCQVKTVAIESTGNYWITTYSLLEEAGIDVCLVNARHVKGVPGKKTDVCDAQWLQQLHAAGLLKKSFRPHKDIVPLRYLMRHRGELVMSSAQQVQLMQKVLTEMNLHIHHVFSDVDGESAQRIISAILAGERDAATLAKLRDRRCRTPVARIIEALHGDYRAEYLFVLQQCQRHWQQLGEAIAQCDVQIAQLAAAVVTEGEPTAPPPAPKQKRFQQKNALNIPIHQEAWRFFGVDLFTVPGMSVGAVSTLMSELGTGSQILAKFRSADAFCSWTGLCPDNRVSGGKILKAKTRKVAHRVAASLRMAAQSVCKSNDLMGQLCRRLKGRLGKAEGIVAVAHKLARVIYAMLTSRQPYDEATAFRQTPSSKARHLQNLQKQAAKLGLQLIPAA
jgi:transposase